MQNFKKQRGGHLFYGLLQPYVNTCIEERQIKYAKDAIKELRGFDIQKGTVMANDARALVELVGRY